MVDRSSLECELNEIGWWSSWASVSWLSKYTYIMLSKEFREPFFNRAGFVTGEENTVSLVEEAESRFRDDFLDAYLYLQDTEEFASLRGSLVSKGYRIVDGMSVMEMRTPSFDVNHDLVVKVIDEDECEEWSKTYLSSFYGSLELLDPVVRIVRRTIGGKGVSFITAAFHGSTVGTSALYVSDGVAGVYCVGTVPAFRKTRVATSVVEFAHRIAQKSGSKLTLQTIHSDNVESLYMKVGFERKYTKSLLTKSLNG